MICVLDEINLESQYYQVVYDLGVESLIKELLNNISLGIYYKIEVPYWAF